MLSEEEEIFYDEDCYHPLLCCLDDLCYRWKKCRYVQALQDFILQYKLDTYFTLIYTFLATMTNNSFIKIDKQVLQKKQLVDYQLEVDKGKLTAVANLES